MGKDFCNILNGAHRVDGLGQARKGLSPGPFSFRFLCTDNPQLHDSNFLDFYVIMWPRVVLERDWSKGPPLSYAKRAELEFAPNMVKQDGSRCSHLFPNEDADTEITTQNSEQAVPVPLWKLSLQPYS